MKIRHENGINTLTISSRRNNAIDDITDSITAIITINLVLQSAFSNLFSNIDILQIVYFFKYIKHKSIIP